VNVIKITGLVLGAIIIIFVANLLISTGFFRTIENTFDGTIVKQIALPGTEDITISHADGFAIISSTDRREFQTSENRRDGLYYLDLKSGTYELTELTRSLDFPFHPHGLSMLKSDNGYRILAINHTPQGHSIEMFALTGKTLTHLETYKDPTFISPNDVVLVDEERFYFTNDHHSTEGFGRLLEDYGGLTRANVVYFDGSDYSVVAKDISYANGINYDDANKLVLVAASRSFSVRVFDQNEDGSLDFREDVPCGTGVDNIEFDEQGRWWIGAHPSLLRFAAYAKKKEETSPSEVIRVDYKGKGDYSVQTVYLDDGKTISASSVAASHGDLIVVGNVMDGEFLILRSK
jgi:arylesterase/paraoxonase